MKQNDPAAWQRLSSLFCPIVYGWARRTGLQSSDASDVMQEVFRAVATNINSFEQGNPGSSFRGWLWTITQNKIRDHFRRAVNRPQVVGGTEAKARMAQVPDSVSNSAAERNDLDPQGELIKRALETIRRDFEPATWQAFWRSAIDGQSTEQIAGDLSLSRQAARQAKYRVLRRLRQELDGLLD